MTEQLPFNGVKVADFSWVWVGPTTGKYLADHGATVVRVETVWPPDRVRGMGPYKDSVPGTNRSHAFADFNTSKLGLSLNLKNPAAIDVARRLIAWADDAGLELIVTTGGTGLGPGDVTPEATREAIDYEAPGLAEAMRLEGLKHTPMAMLSRAVVGVRGRTLIVNLPGSPRGVRENLSVLLPVLPHALETLRGQTEHKS